MGTRSLEINVTSAKGLKKVSKMDVFVAVKLSGDPKCSDHREQRTQAARDGGTSPKWSNDVMKFILDQNLAEANRLVITFKIKCEQRGGVDKDIGEVHVQVKELLDHLGNDKTGQRYVTYQIGKSKADISFTYSFTGPVEVPTGGGCSRYAAQAPVRPVSTYRPVLNGPMLSQLNGPVLSQLNGPVLSQLNGPVLSQLQGPVLSQLNGPVLSQLLPSVGSFSYNHVPCQPPIYPPLAQPEILPPVCFPGLYPPSNMPGSPPTMYQSIFPGLSCPPEGYSTVAPPLTQPGLYPPMSPYRY
ncbi:shock protein SRC2-like [Arabidopsis thaliana]|uniref:At3g62780 n=1 Tax=Arabidopsis thaliana TaxID=3702 RepID=Q9LZI7_ARATH|nr:Calcium-dependent lipid-binding (CaLB domain) family protein [Arabidopsis thaliana]AAS21129.1 At3g62780 [Arabidopsis thaliana]AAS76746.1 At3g62780 [Arabidopsis thaliana]AEE80391.1 Calcium-dependent lipid-binding (CaLB domain) family protein [Arabidopsis thaliana]CAB83128.1 shock protein SRC2-like [Arabidopsis thaliana]|eukprot:NP_191837.1 Calcium-dependent lipid-binding (CaLB domain) family protein [Arabidopsis thaliana]